MRLDQTAAARAEARARDLERRLLDASRAREDATNARLAAEREASTMRAALRLAEDQLKTLVPEWGAWRQVRGVAWRAAPRAASPRAASRRALHTHR